MKLQEKKEYVICVIVLNQQRSEYGQRSVAILVQLL